MLGSDGFPATRFALAAAVFLLAGCGATVEKVVTIRGRHFKGTLVYLPSECSNNVIRPSGFLTACGDGGAGLEHIKWKTWLGPVASGTAIAFANDCEPNCAAGGIHHAPAEIYASNPNLCAGREQYTRVAIIVAKTSSADRLTGSYEVACANTDKGVLRIEPDYEEGQGSLTVPGTPSDLEISERIREAEAKQK